MGEPLEELLTFAERSYVRMEAEQLIIDCLRQGDETEFNDLIQGLYLAGASSIGILREIMDELRVKKSGLSQESLGVRQGLMDSLGELGVIFPQLILSESAEVFGEICESNLVEFICTGDVKLTPVDRNLLQDICSEAGERIRLVSGRMQLLIRLEQTVRDWMQSLAFIAVRTGEPDYPVRGAGLEL